MCPDIAEGKPIVKAPARPGATLAHSSIGLTHHSFPSPQRRLA
jgi:hypothetical protein